MLDCKTLALVPVMGRGEVPVPRVGHATGMVGNVLISWGGDTKTRADEEQDQGLYLLNTGACRLLCMFSRRSSLTLHVSSLSQL